MVRPLQPYWPKRLNEGLKAVAAGMNPMDLKRGIDKAVEAVEAVKALAVPCSDSKAIAQGKR